MTERGSSGDRSDRPDVGLRRCGEAVTRIYLVRHGRTALNAAGVLRGRLDPELDPEGVRQASALSEVVGRQQLRLAVSSPLRRAMQTAAGVVARADLQVEADERFADRDYGQWAGISPQQVVAACGSLDAAPGVEPAAAVLERALQALEAVARRAGDGAALVVSHDVVNRLLLHHVDPSLGELDRLPQDTGCFNVLERRGDRWHVVSVNTIPGAPQPPA